MPFPAVTRRYKIAKSQPQALPGRSTLFAEVVLLVVLRDWKRHGPQAPAVNAVLHGWPSTTLRCTRVRCDVHRDEGDDVARIKSRRRASVWTPCSRAWARRSQCCIARPASS